MNTIIIFLALGYAIFSLYRMEKSCHIKFNNLISLIKVYFMKPESSALKYMFSYYFINS